jgi:hypothetical protein
MARDLRFNVHLLGFLLLGFLLLGFLSFLLGFLASKPFTGFHFGLLYPCTLLFFADSGQCHFQLLER